MPLTQTDFIRPSELIETSSLLIKLHPENDSAELIIKDGVVYDHNLARETKELLEKARPGVKYYLLVSSDGFFRVTKRARKLGASKNFSNHLAAVACHNLNSSLVLLGELYNKINKPAVPTKIFSTRESAEEWLREKKAEVAVA